MSALVLHDYWRSSSAYRVRIALSLKGLAWSAIPHDLRHGEQRSPEYLARNPQGLVPALEVFGETGAAVLTQSLAIIEWLEEAHPAPPLLPADPVARAQARALALIVACDIQPLQNLGTNRHIKAQFGVADDAINDWARHWIARGFDAIEPLLPTAGPHAGGATPGLADCLLIPQAYTAERFGLDLARWPRLAAIIAAGRAHPAIAAAHPDRHGT